VFKLFKIVKIRKQNEISSTSLPLLFMFMASAEFYNQFGTPGSNDASEKYKVKKVTTTGLDENTIRKDLVQATKFVAKKDNPDDCTNKYKVTSNNVNIDTTGEFEYNK